MLWIAFSFQPPKQAFKEGSYGSMSLAGEDIRFRAMHYFTVVSMVNIETLHLDGCSIRMYNHLLDYILLQLITTPISSVVRIDLNWREGLRSCTLANSIFK